MLHFAMFIVSNIHSVWCLELPAACAHLHPIISIIKRLLIITQNVTARTKASDQRSSKVDEEYTTKIFRVTRRSHFALCSYP